MTDKIKEAAEKYAFRVPYDGSNNFYNEDRYKGFMDGATSEAAREYWDAAREDGAVWFAEWVSKEGWMLFSWNGDKWQKTIAYNKRPDKNIYQYATTSELYKLYKNEKL